MAGFSLSFALTCVACSASSGPSPGGDGDAMTTTPLEAGASIESGVEGGLGNPDATITQGMDSSLGDAAQNPGAEAGGGGVDAGGATESGAAGGCASATLCDTFDEDTAGAAPANWMLVLGCNATQMSNDASGGGLLIGVDSSQHHSGSNSVKVVGGDSCGYYFENTSAVAALAPGKQLYARFWAMFSGAPTMNHNGFMSMGLTSTMSTPPQLRLGFQSNIIDWNYIPPDTTLPDLGPSGVAASVATTASTWTCIEFHVDETTGHLEFWLNGTSVSGLSYDGTTTAQVDDQWVTSGPPAPVVPASFGLGWLGLNNQYTIWYDDVALGGARIGCN